MLAAGRRRATLLTFCSAAVASACVPQVAAGAAKPDLAVSSFSGPRAASVDGRFLLLDKTSNKGGPARPSTTIYLLSRDRRRGKGDMRLGARALKVLKAKSSSKGTGRVTVPRKTRPGRFYLLACADGAGNVAETNEKNNCRASSKPTTVIAAFKPNPLNVSAVPDSARAAGGTITTAGGTLLATGSDGTRYTLVVPKDALLSREEITITPLSSLAGLPFKAGLSAGVLLEPSGLSFRKAVTVRIQPAIPVPLKQEATFSFAGTGKDFHLHPVRHRDGALEFELTHFTGVGLAPATALEFDRQGKRVPTSREAATEQRLHEALRAEHEVGDNETTLSGKFREAAELRYFVWGNEGILPLATAAATNDKLLYQAMQEYISWSRQQQLLGVRTTALDALDARIVAQLALGFENAIRKAYEGCLAGDLTQIARIISLARDMALFGASEGTFTFDFLDRCVRFELDYDLQWTMSGEAVHPEVGHVRVQRLLLDAAMVGRKDLEYVSIGIDDPATGCAVSSTRSKEPFEVVSAEFDLNRYPPRYLTLDVRQGLGSETITCPTSDTPFTYETTMYNDAFFALHFGNADLSYGFSVRRWDELGGPPYAKTSLSASHTDDAGRTWQGTSTWTLHHVPLRP